MRVEYIYCEQKEAQQKINDRLESLQRESRRKIDSVISSLAFKETALEGQRPWVLITICYHG